MMGLKDHQIVTHGLPIRPDFAKQHGSLPALRRRLGMDPTLPAVLLVGGGEGMGKLQQTVRAIAGRGVKCQLAVICGRNAALRRQLAEGDWGETVVRAFGFVRNMPEFMAASDAIITKAGAPFWRCAALRACVGARWHQWPNDVWWRLKRRRPRCCTLGTRVACGARAGVARYARALLPRYCMQHTTYTHGPCNRMIPGEGPPARVLRSDGRCSTFVCGRSATCAWAGVAGPLCDAAYPWQR